MDADPRIKSIGKFRDDIQQYMMDSEDSFSNINFKIKNKIRKLISFNRQSITSRVTNKEV